jgi:hypothetical protein
VWFPREPAEMPITEMTKVAGNDGYTLTLLVMPAAEPRWARRDQDEEPVEDSHDSRSIKGNPTEGVRPLGDTQRHPRVWLRPARRQRLRHEG